MRRGTFEKLLRHLGGRLQTDTSKVRYGSGAVTPRMQLTMCLKFLGGDSNHDIKKHMGGLFMLCVHDRHKFYKRVVLATVARSIVSKYNLCVMEVILEKIQDKCVKNYRKIWEDDCLTSSRS